MIFTLLMLSAKNATRNLQRTALTAAGIVLGTALLTVAVSWVDGVFGAIMETASGNAGHVRIAQEAYVDRETLMPTYEHIKGIAEKVQWLKTQPGVVDVYPHITTGATLTVGEEIGDVFGLVHGAPIELYEERFGARSALIGGEWFTGAPDEIVIGVTLADRLGAKAGDELVLLATTQDGAMSPWKGKIVGIVQGDNPLLPQSALLPLEPMQYLVDTPDAATEILVFGSHRDDADGIASPLRAQKPLDGLKVEAWSEREPWGSLATIATVIQSILMAIIVSVAALLVWNTMTMSVLERTREIGVMRAMGLNGFGAVGMFVLEAIVLAVVGGVVGVAIGCVPAYYLEVQGVSVGAQVVGNISSSFPISSKIHADLSSHAVTVAFLMGLVMAIIGAAPPALRAAAIQPVSAMRSGR